MGFLAIKVVGMPMKSRVVEENMVGALKKRF
jgi:hypothetical protein